MIHHFTPNAFVAFGELDGAESERVRGLLGMFSHAGVDAAVSSAIRVELWKKLLLVSSWAGLGALARSPMGVVREEPVIRSLIDRSIEEGLAVARATGHGIDPSYKDEMWAFYRSMPAGATASMQRDIIDGRPSELDAWNGAICRFGAPRRRRDAGALVHVSHAAADGAQGSRPVVSGVDDRARKHVISFASLPATALRPFRGACSSRR